MYKCSLNILRCARAVATNLSLWRCRNKPVKASWHFKDKVNDTK